MANVRKYLQDILNAIYGEEVRGSIHDAIEAMNEESTNAEAVAISSRDSAKHNAEAAEESATEAAASETAAKTSETNAKASETAAKASETAAKRSENNASDSEEAAYESEQNAKDSENAAKASEDAAKASESAARTYSMQAFEYKHDAQESAEAAHQYEQQCEQIRDDIGYPIDPKGTITFANLPSVATAQIGWMYNISDDFTTTSDFEEGSGKFYSAGSEVYLNSNHKWSVMAGPGVTGIKGEAESEYRKGQINVTRAMLGINAANTPYTNTTSGLSATNVQGAIDELDAETFRSRGQCTETDANTIIKPGIYWCNPTVTANLPSTQWGMLEVTTTSMVNQTYPLTQKYVVVSELGNKYYYRTYRYVSPSYVWSDWQTYESATEMYEYNGIMGAKNLITYPYYKSNGYTFNGITYTVQDDGTIIANGTATATSTFEITPYVSYSGNKTIWNKIVKTSSGKFRLTGCPSGGSSGKYYLQISGSDETHATWFGGGMDTGNGLTFSANIDENKFYIYICRIVIVEGCVCDNLVFKPMLRDANDVDETFRPYAMTNKELTAPTFTQASTRANINSGETISTIMGKIKKFFADLKTVAFTGSYNDLLNKPEHLGHSIKDATTTFTDRAGLKFTGNVTVSDDSTNDETIVDVEGSPEYYYDTQAQAEAALSELPVGADVFVEEGSVSDFKPIAFSGKASDVSYNNASSGLDATNVQGAIDKMKTTFQAGVDAIFNAIKNAGVTPSSSTPTDCATAIGNLRTTPYTGTYTYPSGSTGGTVDLGVPHDKRYVNAGNVYSKGVADADARANPSSTNYITGYNNGVAAQAAVTWTAEQHIIIFTPTWASGYYSEMFMIDLSNVSSFTFSGSIAGGTMYYYMDNTTSGGTSGGQRVTFNNSKSVTGRFLHLYFIPSRDNISCVLNIQMTMYANKLR